MAGVFTVVAEPRITTRRRPTGQAVVRPADEVVATHVATCPYCSRETVVRTGEQGVVYGSCPHFISLQQRGTEIEVLFEAKRAA